MADLKEKTYVEDVDRSVYDIRDEENDAYRMRVRPDAGDRSKSSATGEGRSRVDAAVPAPNPSKFTMK